VGRLAIRIRLPDLLPLLELLWREYFNMFTVRILLGQLNHPIVGRTMSLADSEVDDAAQQFECVTGSGDAMVFGDLSANPIYVQWNQFLCRLSPKVFA
jgi:hypothetical protein